MPRSTLSAVFTPVSDKPSSTSVIATAGRMPTTTVSASRMRETAAMLSSMRPMKLSTISREEMSISTPFARVCTIFCVRSSSSAIASRSCMSTCIVMSNASPIFRIGIRSMSRDSARRRGGDVDDRTTHALQRDRKGIGKARFRYDVEIDAQVHHRLRDLRADPAHDAIRSHQTRGGDGLEQVLRHEGIDGGHSSDVDDRDFGAVVDDALQQALHDDLRTRTVERSDERQGEHAVPELDHRRRQLRDLALLTHDDLFSTALIALHRMHAKLVDEMREIPDALRPFRYIAFRDNAEQRSLQREEEERRFRGGESLHGTCARNFTQIGPEIVVGA